MIGGLTAAGRYLGCYAAGPERSFYRNFNRSFSSRFGIIHCRNLDRIHRIDSGRSCSHNFGRSSNHSFDHNFDRNCYIGRS